MYVSHLTEHFTIVEPQNLEIDELYVLVKFESTDFKAL